MLPPGHTIWMRHCILNVRSYSYQTCERDVLKTNEPALMPVGVNDQQGKGTKNSTLRMRSEVGLMYLSKTKTKKQAKSKPIL